MRAVSIGLDNTTSPMLRMALRQVSGEAAVLDSSGRHENVKTNYLVSLLGEYDVIFVPLSLPGYVALRLAELAHRMDSHARVVLISGTEVPRDVLEILFDYFLSDDFFYADLLAVLQQIIAGTHRKHPKVHVFKEALNTVIKGAFCFARRDGGLSEKHLQDVVCSTPEDYRAAIEAAEATGSCEVFAASDASMETRQFDVALSFASRERRLAKELAARLTQRGYAVFYDEYFESQLWGADLATVLDGIYRYQSRYCVAFVSSEYITRAWTAHERRSALARAVAERGVPYMLPIKVEDVELPGLPSTVGYISLQGSSLERIAELLDAKLRGGGSLLRNCSFR